MSKIFGIQDVKADAFMQIFVFNTRAQAIRGFSDLANDKDTSVGRHPEDFRLMVLAEFDESTGAIKQGELESLGFASEYVSKKE